MPEHTLLYKYLDCGGIKVLENGTLRGSIPTKLNDPFEFRPAYLPPTDEEILKSVAEGEDVLIGMLRNARIAAPTWRTAPSDYIRKHPDLVLGYFRQKDVCDDYFERFFAGAEDFRVLCFSLRNDGILLWSHYADHHRGFVLGFDKASLDAPYSSDSRFPVEYRSTRPCMGNLIDLFREGESDDLKKAIRTKSLEWAYEEEYRLVGLKTCEGDNYAKFAPLVLRQVIFGSRCLPKLEERIRQILAGPEYDHVKKSRAFLSNRGYEIEIRDE